MRRVLLIACSAATLAVDAAVAFADSTPIGALPTGPTAAIQVQRGELVAVAVPQRTAGIWRIARPFDANVLREVSEANVDGSVVLLFRARNAGRTTVSMALTKSDSSSVALESRQFRVEVRR